MDTSLSFDKIKRINLENYIKETIKPMGKMIFESREKGFTIDLCLLSNLLKNMNSIESSWSINLLQKEG